MKRKTDENLSHSNRNFHFVSLFHNFISVAKLIYGIVSKAIRNVNGTSCREKKDTVTNWNRQNTIFTADTHIHMLLIGISKNYIICNYVIVHLFIRIKFFALLFAFGRSHAACPFESASQQKRECAQFRLLTRRILFHSNSMEKVDMIFCVLCSFCIGNQSWCDV